MKNNKGFSLVELIIVIAIMAILVGVMAPQLIRYIEKTNVSADTQLCDSVHTAVLTAMMDPAVLTSSGGVPAMADVKLSSISASTHKEFYDSIKNTLGWPDLTDGTQQKLFKSSAKGTGVIYLATYGTGNNAVATWIANSDKTGDKSNDSSATLATAAASNSRVIFID